MPEPTEQLIAETLDKFLERCVVYAGLMATLSKELEEHYRGKLLDLQKRSNKAAATAHQLATIDEQLQYGLAAFDGLTEELNKLIVEMRKTIDVRFMI